MSEQVSPHLTADAALLLGRAESRWLKQARQRLRADHRPDHRPTHTTDARQVDQPEEDTR